MADKHPDKFPNYQGGDVSIVISPVSDLYCLHRNVLVEHSSTFNNILTAETAAKLNRKAIKEGQHIKYRLELKMIKYKARTPHFALEKFLIDENGNIARVANSRAQTVLALNNGLPTDPYYVVSADE